MKMGKKVVRLNEDNLRYMVKEALKRVLKEGYGDQNWFMNNERKPSVNTWDDDREEYASPEEEAKDFFYNSEFDGEDVEIDVQDEETGEMNVHISKDGWEFWFRARGERVDERDLYCTLSRGGDASRQYTWNMVEFKSPDGEEGSRPIGEYGSTLLIKDFFGYSNITNDVDDVY